MTTEHLDEYMSLREAAAHLGVALSTMKKWVYKLELVRRYRLGPRSVMLRREDVDKLIQRVPQKREEA